MNRLSLLVMLSIAWASPVHAQERAHSTLFARGDGAHVRAILQVELEPGWHIYHEFLGDGGGVGRPTEITWGGAGIVWSPTRFPEPERIPAPGVTAPGGGPGWIFGHEGTVLLYAKGRFESGTADVSKISVSISGLTCDEKACIPYEEAPELEGPGKDVLFERFPADLMPGDRAASGAGSARTSRVDSSPEATSPKWNEFTVPDFESRGETDRSLWLWLVFAFLAGSLLNVMPCVLPVVSIKVLSFVQQAGESKTRVFQLSLAFAAGILAVFAALAAFAAFAGLGWGEQFQKEPFKIAMVAIVFAFSLSLFDVYELGLPSKVGELAAVKREGMRDAFFKGIMATLLATPCSGPFLGSTLAWAVTQPPQAIIAVFLLVGAGMAAPYVVLASNPGFLRYLPRPGAWMHTFKHATGFLLLATVVFLMIAVRQDLLLYTVAMLVFVALGCWWWGKFATFEQTPFQHLRTLVVALALAGGGTYVVFGPVKSSLDPEAGLLAWEKFDPDALARYQAEGRPVMLDFTADW
jgi:cytochrome c biogenesis protein CcdA